MKRCLLVSLLLTVAPLAGCGGTMMTVPIRYNFNSKEVTFGFEAAKIFWAWDEDFHAYGGYMYAGLNSSFEFGLVSEYNHAFNTKTHFYAPFIVRAGHGLNQGFALTVSTGARPFWAGSMVSTDFLYTFRYQGKASSLLEVAPGALVFELGQYEMVSY